MRRVKCVLAVPLDIEVPIDACTLVADPHRRFGRRGANHRQLGILVTARAAEHLQQPPQ